MKPIDFTIAAAIGVIAGLGVLGYYNLLNQSRCVREVNCRTEPYCYAAGLPPQMNRVCDCAEYAK